jgi:DNA-binding GntR family transcriptional regulator
LRVGPIAAPVRSQTVGNLRNAILTGRFAPGARLVEAEQIYEVRALLEGQAAYLFATRASKEQVSAMRAALRRFEDAVRQDDAEARLLHTDAFYNVMLKGCGNVVIADLLMGVHARINFLRARSMSQQGRSSESARELRRILSAIAAGDAEKARAASIEHVRRAANAAEASFATQSSAATRRRGKMNGNRQRLNEET